MKPSFARRFLRRSRSASHSDPALFKKENSEPAFFDAAVAQPFFNAAPQALQRKCEKCEDEQKKKEQQAEMKKPEAAVQEKKKDEDKKLQRKESGAGSIASAASLASPGAGSPLPAPLNSFFSQALGRDFSDVKIHTGAEADQAAKSVRARAYTLGKHVVFANGAYQPESTAGKHLLAHELVHVVQQDPERLSRMPAPENPAQEEDSMGGQFLGFVGLSGAGSPLPQPAAHGNCAGASVSGLTTANYDHGSYSVSNATLQKAKDCKGCAEDSCVTVSGVIVHTFHANPSVALDPVPPGNWSACEKKAIQTFINTTLSQHEQQHVAAFKTYNGSAKTPFSYTGCKEGLDAYVKSIHDGINKTREDTATAKSDLLDANGANQFSITCDCPDPKPKEDAADTE